MTIMRPRFKYSFVVAFAGESEVLLVGEGGSHALHGDLYRRVAALIDGCRTADEIVEALDGQVGAAEAYYALIQLEDKGYIVEADDETSPAEAAFWELQGVPSRLAAERLRASAVAVTHFGCVPSEQTTFLVGELEALGVRVSEGDGDLALVVTDDYLQPDLDAFNRAALAAGRPWLIVRPVGSLLWIGPVFRPGQTACWACLAQRLRDNRMVESFVLKQQERAAPLVEARAALPTTWRTALNLAATEAAKFVVTGASPRLEGTLVTFDTLAVRTQDHPVTRRPNCPVCGDTLSLASKQPRPIELVSRPTRFTADGGHRAAAPEETFARYQHLISPITGAVTRLDRVGRSRNDVVHAYAAGHNFALGLGNLSMLRKSLRSNSGGKGKTDLQAKVSALCEALERYCGVYKGDEPRTWGTFAQMRDVAIHPNACMLYSEKQYHERATWNAKESKYQLVPAPFDDQARIEWTPLWSLTDDEFRYLPTAYLYYGYNGVIGADVRYGDGYAWADSNGNAAGNTIEEAILQGFLELVERDAVAIWWYNRPQRPAVDLDSFDDPYFRTMKQYLAEIGRDLWVLDVTSDLGIPAFAAVAPQLGSPDKAQIVVGFGAHFDPTIGILRALTEVNQFLAAFDALDGDIEASLAWDPDTLTWWRTATLATQPYLLPSQTPARTRTDYGYRPTNDLRLDVLRCVEVCRRLGLEMLVLDQTRPDIGLSVAKVVVPGLRHFWARFAPGRLYEVPVQLGWLEAPRREEELNPLPVFF